MMSGMRDPKRLNEILALVEEAWHQSPDLRFMQLVLHLYSGLPKGISEDYFYTEDDALLAHLRLKVQARRLV